MGTSPAQSGEADVRSVFDGAGPVVEEGRPLPEDHCFTANAMSLFSSISSIKDFKPSACD